MSRIVLEPGEVFEHTHESDSSTTLVEGEIRLEVAGASRTLERGVPVPIDAGVSHRLVNVGDGEAAVMCRYPVATE